MGDPRKQKKKYATPRHPWIKTRIEQEKKLVEEYGLKNKKEIYRANTELKRYTNATKALTKLGEDKQAQKEAQEIVTRLKRYNILQEDQGTEDILGLSTTNFLDRRLQTIVARRGLALTMKQARQLITHGHIRVNGRKISAPSYLVKKDDEITFTEKSSFANDEQPERAKKIQTDKKEIEQAAKEVTEQVTEEPPKEKVQA